MNFDWRQFLCTANVLLKQNKVKEPHFRAAVSRAYYAAYHIAKIYAESKGGSQDQFPGSGSHEWVGKWLKGRGYKNISEKFFFLKDQRRIADYEINPYGISLNHAWAQAAYRNAILLVKEVSKLP